MLHPLTNPPTCTPQLQKLNEIARLLLAFGLENDATTLGLAAIKAGNVKRLFAAYCKQQGKEETGKWLCNKPKLLTYLRALLDIPLCNKDQILPAFDADQQLENCFSSGQFNFLNIPVGNQAALEIVGEIMRYFYKEVLRNAGVPGNLIGKPDILNRPYVVQSYRGNLKVCPGCDGEINAHPEEVRYDPDLDHFFPESKYPFVAIHPLNLVPLCGYCNQRVKRDKDIFDPAYGATSMDEIFHPFLRPARDEVVVKVERDPADRREQVIIYPKVNNSANQTRLQHLNHILELQQRWQITLQLEKYYDYAEQRLRDASLDERYSHNFQPDDAWLQKKLLNLAFDSYSIGKLPDAVVTQAYIKFVAQDTQSRVAKWLPYMESLCEGSRLMYNPANGKTS
ncbi:MAG TPA: hypothetical protein VH186_22135 [Chloroflexia bacterium]|nr:hypothetical protein [Chloroflexia bacterium]